MELNNICACAVHWLSCHKRAPCTAGKKNRAYNAYKSHYAHSMSELGMSLGGCLLANFVNIAAINACILEFCKYKTYALVASKWLYRKYDFNIHAFLNMKNSSFLFKLCTWFWILCVYARVIIMSKYEFKEHNFENFTSQKFYMSK